MQVLPLYKIQIYILRGRKHFPKCTIAASDFHQMWEFSPHPVDNGQWVHWTLIANPSNHCPRINFDWNILHLIFWIEILTCLRLPGIIRRKYCQEMVKIVRDVRKIARNWQESSQDGGELVVKVSCPTRFSYFNVQRTEKCSIAMC